MNRKFDTETISYLFMKNMDMDENDQQFYLVK